MQTATCLARSLAAFAAVLFSQLAWIPSAHAHSRQRAYLRTLVWLFGALLLGAAPGANSAYTGRTEVFRDGSIDPNFPPESASVAGQIACGWNGWAYCGYERALPPSTPLGYMFRGFCIHPQTQACEHMLRFDSNMICPPGYDTVPGQYYCVMPSPAFVPDKNQAGGGNEGMCPAGKGKGVGNPCDPTTGNKWDVEVDYQSGGNSPLRFSRTYNSLVKQTTRFGHMWRGYYERYAQYNVTADTPIIEMVAFHRHDGNVKYFTLNDGVWTADADIHDKVERLFLSGNPAGWRLTSALDDEVEEYDVEGFLTSITTRAGMKLTLAYDTAPAKKLVSVTDPFGRSLTFTYDGSGRVATMTDPAGGVFTFGYGANNNLVTVTYPDTKVKTYHYENTSFPKALTGITDENGARFATYAYDADGKVSSTEQAGATNRYTFSYGRGATTVTDPLNEARTYNFQGIIGVNKLSTITGSPCPSCGPAATTYETPVGLPDSRTDWNGNRTNYTYTADNRGLEATRIEGLTSAGATIAGITRTVTTEWETAFRLPKRIAEPLRRTSFTYDANGNVLTRTIQATSDTDGGQGFNATLVGTARTWTYTYNAYGRVLTANGPRTDVADTTTYAYHADNATCTATVLGASATGCRGQVNTITNAAGHVTTAGEYNAHGQPLKVTDPNTVVTTLAYDARMRLTSRIRGGESATFAYDDAGQLKKVTAPDASFVEYTYDAAHRLTELRDNLANKIVYTLDLMGNRTAENVYDPTATLRQTHTRVYSTLNRLSQDVGAAGQTTAYTYDNQGNLKTIDRPLSAVSDVTTNDYDALNRLKQVTDAIGGITQYTYDRLDQLTQVTDPIKLPTAYTIDGLGNLTQQVSRDTGTTDNTYDEAGNLKTSTDARGKVTTYTYDALNRVTAMTFADTAQNIAFTYDQGTNGKGRLTQVTDATGNTQWEYDAIGRVVRKWQQSAARVHVVQYAYDVQGRLANIIYPSGRVIAYSYDGAGRVAGVTIDGVTLMNGITYHPFGQPKDWTWGNGRAHARTFDLDGRMATQVLGTEPSSPYGNILRTIGYDPASRIIQLDEGTAVTTRVYGYDAIDRLTSFAVNKVATQGFDYDASGNRTTLTSGGTPYNYTYQTSPAPSNRLLSTAGPTARSYVHDNAGNVTGDGTRTFGYDERGRMTQATHGGNTFNYHVNALGQRVGKSGAGQQRYVYDEAGRLIGEYDQAGDTVREVVFLGDMPVAVIRADEVVVDNTTSQSTGNWATQDTVPGYYGENYRTKDGGDGSATFAWTPPVPSSQQYQVYARWVAAAGHATNATYTVNHAGEATPVTVNQTTGGGAWNLLGTFTLAPGQGHKIELTDNANGAVVADAIKIVPAAQTEIVSYIHADHLNTPLRVVSQGNQVRWRWDPAPFGESAPDENPSGLGAFVFNHRFPGQLFDAETGLHYNYFRDYDPGIGRYIQSDPMGLRGGINTYSYVRASPLITVDPKGLDFPGGISGIGRPRILPPSPLTVLVRRIAACLCEISPLYCISPPFISGGTAGPNDAVGIPTGGATYPWGIVVISEATYGETARQPIPRSPPADPTGVPSVTEAATTVAHEILHKNTPWSWKDLFRHDERIDDASSAFVDANKARIFDCLNRICR